jgi:uncharacterized HhH-GPD family protein
LSEPRQRLRISGDAAADDLISRDPFSLVCAMLLDQQIPMEKAFTGPAVLLSRLGGDRLDPVAVAGMDAQAFAEVMAGPPAVHRYHTSMAGRVQALAQHIVEHYGADTASLWSQAADGAELKRRLVGLPGFGEQKAKIFIALLGKQVGVELTGWREAAGDYGLDGYRSVADVVDDVSLTKVREYKKAVKAGTSVGRPLSPAS